MITGDVQFRLSSASGCKHTFISLHFSTGYVIQGERRKANTPNDDLQDSLLLSIGNMITANRIWNPAYIFLLPPVIQVLQPLNSSQNLVSLFSVLVPFVLGCIAA